MSAHVFKLDFLIVQSRRSFLSTVENVNNFIASDVYTDNNYYIVKCFTMNL